MRRRLLGKKLKMIILISGVLILAGIVTLKDYFVNPYTITARMADSPQFSNNKFLNPGKNMKFSGSDMLKSTWDFIFNDNDRKPKTTIPR